MGQPVRSENNGDAVPASEKVMIETVKQQVVWLDEMVDSALLAHKGEREHPQNGGFPHHQPVTRRERASFAPPFADARTVEVVLHLMEALREAALTCSRCLDIRPYSCDAE